VAIADHSAEGWKGSVTLGWKRSAAPERQVMTQRTPQTPRRLSTAPSDLLRSLVDLAGIEPATSSMPFP